MAHANIPDFRRYPPNQLDAFIAQYLQPDEQFHVQVSSAMDNLCRFLQQELKPNVIRVVKSGSMGKGTAIKHSSDLDCILILKTIKDPVQLRDNIRALLDKIKSCLIRQPLQGWRFDIKKIDEYLLQFGMINTNTGKTTKVDLLPTFDANVTNSEARMTLYKRMPSLDEKTRSYCSAALAELQKDFIIEKPAKLKDLIRLTKHWAKTYLPSSTSMPKSYLVELVTIYRWERAGSTHRFNTAAVFKDIMMAFSNHSSFNISWTRYYTLTQQNSSSPRILDPANPYNNIYEDVNDWETVARVARQTLQMPALQL